MGFLSLLGVSFSGVLIADVLLSGGTIAVCDRLLGSRDSGSWPS